MQHATCRRRLSRRVNMLLDSDFVAHWDGVDGCTDTPRLPAHLSCHWQCACERAWPHAGTWPARKGIQVSRVGCTRQVQEARVWMPGGGAPKASAYPLPPIKSSTPRVGTYETLLPRMQTQALTMARGRVRTVIASALQDASATTVGVRSLFLLSCSPSFNAPPLFFRTRFFFCVIRHVTKAGPKNARSN